MFLILFVVAAIDSDGQERSISWHQRALLVIQLQNGNRSQRTVAARALPTSDVIRFCNDDLASYAVEGLRGREGLRSRALVAYLLYHQSSSARLAAAELLCDEPTVLAILPLLQNLVHVQSSLKGQVREVEHIITFQRALFQCVRSISTNFPHRTLSRRSNRQVHLRSLVNP